MQLLTILLSLAFMHLWGAANPLHRDGWYWLWLERLARQPWLADQQAVRLMLGAGVPVIALLAVMGILAAVSHWLLLPLSIVVLLYSFGRHTMAEEVDAYVSAYACDDWALAVRQAEQVGVDVAGVQHSDWLVLHEQVLRAAVYRGFERLFAVLFWFLLLGPVGALLYRLSWFYRHSEYVSPLAERWLWLLEWPGVRLLGISFAVTGNFVGCVQHWRQSLLCRTRTSSEVLYHSVMGALAVDDAIQPSPEVTRRELSAVQSLYRRTLWLWLGCIGLWSILR